MDPVKPNKTFKENYSGNIFTVLVFTVKSIMARLIVQLPLATSCMHLHFIRMFYLKNFNSGKFNKKGFGIEINHYIIARQQTNSQFIFYYLL